MSSIKQNELLANYCTYKIGGPARVLFFADSTEEIIAGLEVARANNYPFFILGGGSNVLFPDSGFPGLVLKIENSFIESIKTESGANLHIGAGTALANLCRYALDNSLTGMEWASGIPGTVGGAIRGNAGAFHEEISESVIQVNALEMTPDGIDQKIFSKPDCKFSYRESIFKHNPNLIIESIQISLLKGDNVAIKRQMDDYLAKKATTQPIDQPSAGSVFMNPPGFFAAKVVEDCGFKGKAIGDAKVAEKHANFIVNTGNAKADDVKELINQIKAAAKEKYNLDLKEEIEIVK